MYDFENTVAVITGSGSGIGRATAKRFATEGATVVVADIDTEAGEETVRQIKDDDGDAQFKRVDAGQSESIADLIDATVEQCGRLDYAVNNAAVGNTPAQLSEIDEAEWDRVLSINQTGVWAGMKHEIPAMSDSGGGAIVNVSSKAGVRGSPGRAPYAASKHGVVGLTRTAALETATDEIRVNAVCPTIVETAALESMSEAERESITDAVPMNRAASPEEVANAIVWLCSNEASFVTGQALPVDGGETQK
jgi:NAD(P)-dependent dehydrogenase (short-subunit alcohol dehydrogenase family)